MQIRISDKWIPTDKSRRHITTSRVCQSTIQSVELKFRSDNDPNNHKTEYQINSPKKEKLTIEIIKYGFEILQIVSLRLWSVKMSEIITYSFFSLDHPTILQTVSTALHLHLHTSKFYFHREITINTYLTPTYRRPFYVSYFSYIYTYIYLLYTFTVLYMSRSSYLNWLYNYCLYKYCQIIAPEKEKLKVKNCSTISTITYLQKSKWIKVKKAVLRQRVILI